MTNKARTEERRLDLLLKARDDVRVLIDSGKPHNRSYSIAAEIYYLLAINTCDEKEKDKHLRMALICFCNATDCHDGENVPDTNFKLAQCLKYKGDLQSAMASYQVAYEVMTNNANGFKSRVAQDVLCTMFQYYSIKESPGTLLKDSEVHIAHWLECIVSEFSDDDLSSNSE